MALRLVRRSASRAEWLAMRKRSTLTMRKRESGPWTIVSPDTAPRSTSSGAYPRPDVSCRWMRTRGLCVRDETERASRISGSVDDISMRIQPAEAALRLSEKRYALAMEASGEGHWDWNVAVRRVLRRPADARAVRISSWNDLSPDGRFPGPASLASGGSPDVGDRGRRALCGHDDPHRHGDSHPSTR